MTGPFVWGIDLASGPDQTVTARLGPDGWTVEDLEVHPLNDSTGEMLRKMRERMDEKLLAEFYGRDNFGPAGDPRLSEIITDPADERGMYAKRVLAR